MTITRAFLILSAVLAIAAGASAVRETARIQPLEQDVSGFLSAPRDERWVVGHMSAASLEQGQQATFELCGRVRDPARLGLRRVEIWAMEAREVAQQIDLVDRSEAVQWGGTGELDGVSYTDFCVTIAHWEEVLITGQYAVALSLNRELIPSNTELEAQEMAPNFSTVRGDILESQPEGAFFRGRIISWQETGAWAIASVALAFFAALFLIFAALLRPSRPEVFPDGWADAFSFAKSPLGRAVIGLFLLVVVLFGFPLLVAGLMPTRNFGSLGVLFHALFLLIAQLVLSMAMSSKKDSPLNALALFRPTRTNETNEDINSSWVLPALLVLGSLAIGCAFIFVHLALENLIPSTGVAPIETFFAAPSGRFVMMFVAIAAPVIEEIFFRGFIFGQFEKAGKARLAFVVSALSFWAFHLPQQWGNWPAAGAVLLLSLVLTGLRMVTRSTTTSAAAHLGHNVVLQLTRFL